MIKNHFPKENTFKMLNFSKLPLSVIYLSQLQAAKWFLLLQEVAQRRANTDEWRNGWKALNDSIREHICREIINQLAKLCFIR